MQLSARFAPLPLAAKTGCLWEALMVQKGSALYSLIETAKLNDVNPEGYLKFLLEHYIDPEADEKFLEKLMPWHAKIPEDYPKPSLNLLENTS
jgi:hypothetical protein